MSNDIKKLLLGRVLTNVSDSLVYMAILWYFNRTFSSPMVTSAVFILMSTIDLLSFTVGPVIDRKDSVQLLTKWSVVQIIATFLLVLFFYFLILELLF